MRRFCRALVAVPVAISIYAMTAWGQQPPETVTIIKEFEFDGSVSKNVIFEKTDKNPWYNGASVGIDRNGYIHVAGNMHHSPFNHPKTGNPYYEYAWQYVVSDKPEDISSFTFVGGDQSRTIPGPAGPQALWPQRLRDMMPTPKSG
jgi:hypothetical protein